MSSFLLNINQLVGETPLGRIGDNSPLSFNLQRKQVGVFFGGKEPSQLWRLILGKGTVNDGSIEFGAGIHKSEENIQWRQQIGFVHRDKGLISNLSLVENVLLPVKYHGITTEPVEQILAEAKIKESDWGKRPSELGWVARKKTLLARSVVLNPQILIMDDPTELYPFTDYHELFQWIELQKKKGRGILVGTENIPFGLAIADWFLSEKNAQMSEEFQQEFSPEYLETAKNFKVIMNQQSGNQL